MQGSHAVLHHIQAGFRHLVRGQEDADESLFTDAVYRTNQAFEGSIKEAYRVPAGSDPAQVRPYDIENYLNENHVFGPSVLDQFRTYRQKWRNPSTHDYTLSFHESEVFLALVSVSAFAYLLLGQIGEKLFRRASEIELSSENTAVRVGVLSERQTLLD